MTTRFCAGRTEAVAFSCARLFGWRSAGSAAVRCSIRRRAPIWPRCTRTVPCVRCLLIGPCERALSLLSLCLLLLLLLFSISTVCWEKCVTKKNQPELSIGETACIDRCVLKYLATTTKVAEVFAVHMQQGQAAQAPQQ